MPSAAKGKKVINIPRYFVNMEIDHVDSPNLLLVYYLNYTMIR